MNTFKMDLEWNKRAKMDCIKPVGGAGIILIGWLIEQPLRNWSKWETDLTFSRWMLTSRSISRLSGAWDNNDPWDSSRPCTKIPAAVTTWPWSHRSKVNLPLSVRTTLHLCWSEVQAFSCDSSRKHIQHQDRNHFQRIVHAQHKYKCCCILIFLIHWIEF